MKLVAIKWKRMKLALKTMKLVAIMWILPGLPGFEQLGSLT